MEALFNKVKSICKKRLPSHSYEMWIDPIQYSNSDSNRIILSAPNIFLKRRLLGQYAEMIKSELLNETGENFTLEVEISGGKEAPSGEKPRIEFQAQTQLCLPGLQIKPHYGRLLRRDFTFDQFVVSGNNDFAFSAALAHATRKYTDQHTLLLLSQTGMGKSHLSQAVGHHILAERPGERVFYMTAEDFTNEMIHSLRHGHIDQFKKKYRDQCDILLVEDVHFLSGKTRTQDELAATLDYLYDTGKKIIFSSCYAPIDIPKISDQLRSRLSSGLITRIESPNHRTRVRILQKKAKARGVELPVDVCHYLASELSEDVRQLESGLIGVVAKSSLLGKEIDLKLAESVVTDISRKHKSVTIDSIKELVCNQFGISAKEISSKSRKQQISRPRQIAMYLTRKYTDTPLQAIGQSYNRYHATVLHAITAIELEIKENSTVKQQVERLVQKIEQNYF